MRHVHYRIKDNDGKVRIIGKCSEENFHLKEAADVDIEVISKKEYDLQSVKVPATFRFSAMSIGKDGVPKDLIGAKMDVKLDELKDTIEKLEGLVNDLKSRIEELEKPKESVDPTLITNGS